MKKSCPWCLEPLPVRFSGPDCPKCGRSIGGVGEPEALRIRCDRVEAAQTAKYRKMLTWGVPMVAGLSLGAPFLHFGVLAVVPLVVAAHLVVARVFLVRDAQRVLGPVRRMLNRWLARFGFLWLGLPGYGAMSVPVAGVIAGAGTFAVLTTLVHVSTLVALARERDGRSLALWEKLIPAVLAILTIGLLLLMIGVAVLFGWSVVSVAERLQSP